MHLVEPVGDVDDRRPAGRAGGGGRRRAGRPPAARARRSARRGSARGPRPRARARSRRSAARRSRSEPTGRSGSRSTPICSSTASARWRTARQLHDRRGGRAAGRARCSRRRVSVGRVLELLVDHPHAGGARRDRGQVVVALAGDLDLAGVRRVVAGEDLHERRLAGAVLAEQGEDRAAGGVEVDSVEDLDAAERLADPARAAGELSRGRGVAARRYLQAFG